MVLAALITTGGVVLAACAAGQQAQTARQYPTVDGANAQLGSVALRFVAIEYPEGGVYRQGADAPLRLALVNSGASADTLTEVRTDAAGDVVFEAAEAAGPAGSAAATSASGTASGSPTGTASGSPEATASGTGAAPTPTGTAAPGPTDLALPPNVTVRVGERQPGTSIVLQGLTRRLRPAEIVSITFVFRTAGSITVEVPVATPREEVEPAPTIEGGGEE